MAGDRLADEGCGPEDGLNSRDGSAGGQRRFLFEHGKARLAGPYRPDASLPPGADVTDEGAEHEQIWMRAPQTKEVLQRPTPEAGADVADEDEAAPLLRVEAKPREVEVRDLKAERVGRVFPCLEDGVHYTGCVGYDECKVLCWSPRPREREAVVRVEKPTAGPCRDCVYAREVRGEVAILNGREVRLMECRLGYWHGRTTVYDFGLNKIALNVGLPCPGYTETEAPHPAVARLREAARRRKMGAAVGKEEQADE